MSTAAAMAGALLCTAGAAKAADRDATAPMLRGIGVPRALVRAARFAVPLIEVLCGAWLLSSVAAVAAAGAAATLAAAFAAALLLASLRGVAAPCRCFGSLDRSRSHRVSLARALLLLGVALSALALAMRGAGTAPLAAEWWLGVLLALAAVLGFALVGEAMAFRTGVRLVTAGQGHHGNEGHTP